MPRGHAHGFVTDGDTFTTIDVPGAAGTVAYGINARGQIVGRFFDATERGRGFVTDGDTFTPIDGPGALDTGAHGINDRGQIIGQFIGATGYGHVFLATP
jgi:probable HAF family extracellular repeat protein